MATSVAVILRRRISSSGCQRRPNGSRRFSCPSANRRATIIDR